MTLARGTRLGPYEILGPIGSGGMGEVYRARDERLSRDVAVKVLPPSFAGDADRLRRFEQEARAAGQLNHPNILAVYDTGSHDGAPYVVEELVEGDTLRQKLAAGPLPPRKALDYAAQIARGMAAAHQKGIVHRDLKPENLIVTPDGRVKILDFGLAKILRPRVDHAAMTDLPTQAETGAGVVVGTAGYMSPEQVRGQPADPRSDIFSFGSILYEMIAGRRAFQAASSVETMNAILKLDPPDLGSGGRELPAGLDRLVQHCLEKSPEERFQSARDLAFQIEAISSPSATLAGGEGAPRAPRFFRARPWAAAIVILLAVGAGVPLGRLTRRAAGVPTYTQLTYQQGSLGSARFTPDGETVIYSAAWEGGAAEIFSTRAGGPESRPLGLPRAEILAVSSSGEMAVLLEPHFTVGYQREGTLARAPLAGGVPREVLDGVHDADWAPDGSGLAVARVVEGRYRLEYPIGKVLYETQTWISSPRFSRDGGRIAFIDHPLVGDSRGRVAMVDLSGRLTPLTEPFNSMVGLAWSPSGEEIWFTAGRTGNVMALYAVGGAGGERMVYGAPAHLTLHDVSAEGKVLIARNTSRRGIRGTAPGDPTERDLSWLDWSRPGALSADGRWLLFEEQGQGGGPAYSVYLRGTDGSPAVRLGDGYSLALSPDGKWALTTPVDNPDRLILLPRGPGEPRTLGVPGYAVQSGSWLPDGRRILFSALEGGQLARFYVIDEAGGSPRPVTPEGVELTFAIAPDGNRVATSMRGGVPTIFPIDAGEPRAIPGAESDDIVLSWSRDGGSLYVAKKRRLPVKVERLEIATGRRSPWKELMPADPAGLDDVGFVILAEESGSYVYSYRRALSTLYLAQGLE